MTDELGRQGTSSIVVQGAIGTLPPLRVNRNALVATNSLKMTLRGVAIPEAVARR